MKNIKILLLISMIILSTNASAMGNEERTDILQKGVYKLIKKSQYLENKIKRLQSTSNRNTDRTNRTISLLKEEIKLLKSASYSSSSPASNRRIAALEKRMSETELSLISQNTKLESIREDLSNKIQNWVENAPEEYSPAIDPAMNSTISSSEYSKDGTITITKYISKNTPATQPSQSSDPKTNTFFDEIFSKMKIKIK